MLARRLPGLLPPLVVRRGAGGHDDPFGGRPAAARRRAAAHRGRFARRITRARTSRSSAAAACRGPGELSLAHGGVLFLDELPEFSRRVLETLRQPLEQGVVHIARAARSVDVSRRVMLVGAMNPCPCGFAADRTRTCRCPPGAIERYQRGCRARCATGSISRVELPAVPWRDMRGAAAGRIDARRPRARDRGARPRSSTRQGCAERRPRRRRAAADLRVRPTRRPRRCSAAVSRGLA